MQVQKRMMESSTPKKRKLNVTIDLDEECFLTDEQTLSLYETSTVVSSEINSSKISFNIDDNEVIEDIEINLIPNHIHDTEKHEDPESHIQDEPETHVLEVHNCCTSLCIAKVDALTKITARRDFTSLSKYNQEQAVLHDLIRFKKRCGNRSSIEECQFMIMGEKCCLAGWKKILGITDGTFKKVKKYFNDGMKDIPFKNTTSRKSIKTNIARAWLNNYFMTTGEKMPTRKQILLPSFLTKTFIYDFFKSDTRHESDPRLSYSGFCKLWKQEFSYVTIPARDRMSKCETCVIIKEELQKTRNKLVKNSLRTILEEHNKLQREQRTNYYKHRFKAKETPEKLMTVIIDGMDQAKLMLPMILKLSKAFSDAVKLKTHLTGCLDHGRAPYVIIDFFTWKHDSNHTINCLLKVLERRNFIPDILYLHLDNTPRENKNQYVFTFLALLVASKIFKKIKLYFLMVGHTHEDVDQMFSCFSRKNGHKNVLTVSELIQSVKDGYSPTPEVEIMKQQFNVKDWMTNAMTGLHNITYPHCFKFYMNSEGKVEMKYKNWCEDKKWLPENEGIIILKDLTILQDTAELLPQNYDCQDFPKLKKDMKKYYSGSTLFTNEHKEEWEHLVNTESHYYHPEVLTEWAFTELLTKKPNASSTEHVSNDSYTADKLRERILQKDRAAPPMVYTGPYRKAENVASTVVRTDQFLEELRVGAFVAVRLENWDKHPVLGKVLSHNERSFKIHYWQGGYNKQWKPHMLFQGRQQTIPWTDDLPLSCAVLVGFTLDGNNKLLPGHKKYLKEKYESFKL